MITILAVIAEDCHMINAAMATMMSNTDVRCVRQEAPLVGSSVSSPDPLMSIVGDGFTVLLLD